jgi:molybdenum cofactor biosynthesis protein A
MPENGIQFMKKQELLTFEEMLRVIRILSSQGINKVRITGGEPFLRKDLDTFLKRLKEIPGIDTIRITTNGTLTSRYIPLFRELGIDTINLSLDTLDSERFRTITRRDDFETVYTCMQKLLEAGIHVKINMVVMHGINEQDIHAMAELAKHHSISVRFIEEMPFNGTGRVPDLVWNYTRIEEELRKYYKQIVRLPLEPGNTSYEYQVPGLSGKIGIIAAYSRTFCGSCNRIRITPQGILKTCLYDQGVFNLRDLMRNGADDEAVLLAIIQACNSRARDGFEAEKNLLAGHESMASIGG